MGASAVLIAFLLMIGAGLRIALRTEVPFERLLATGLTVLIGVQSFIIIAGVLRVLPLTGVTLPFVSYGGSSLIANYVLLALLLRISDDTAHPAVTSRRQGRPLGSPDDPADPRAGLGLIVCFVVLFVQLNRLTVFQAAELNDNPNNTRDILRDFSQPRGSITTADGVVIARSVPSTDRFEFQREYPEGDAVRPHHRLLQLHARQLGRREDLQRRAGRAHVRAVVPGAGRPLRRRGPRRRPHAHRAQRPAAHRRRAARPARGLGGGAGPAHRRDPHHGLVPVLRPQRAREPQHHRSGHRPGAARRRAPRSPGSHAPTRSGSSRAPPSRW